MTLRELISKISYSKCINFKNYEIEDVTENSKAAKSGTVFVTVRGNNFDGKDFIGEARERGVKVFIREEFVSLEDDETLIIVENARKTLAEISCVLYGECLSKMKIIGITGTKGKTTTAKILSSCLSHIGVDSVTISTLGIEYSTYSKEKIITENTTPASDIIYRTLKDAYSMGIKVAVIEVSSQALISYRVYGIPFTVCIFTNFSPDHIGRYEHKTREEYLFAKKSLFSDYGAKIGIINSDDENSEFISCGMERIITVGKENASFSVSILSYSEKTVKFSINGEEFNLSLGGLFNASNAAFAIVASAVLFAKEVSAFKNALENINIDGRFELYELDGKNVIVDFAHNKESFESVIKSAKKFTRGRIILLFGAVGERSQGRRRELAKTAEALADFSIITSDNPGFECPEKICSEINSHFKDKSKAKIICDREAAVRFAIEYAEMGDAVLLLGKGHETFQEINGKKLPFSERDIIISLGAKKL